MGRQITPPDYHVVEQGDYILNLALCYGLSKWEDIWQHQNNGELRQNRESPNILLPGDLVFIPAPDTKSVAASTEKKHRFQLIAPATEFELSVLDDENEPRKSLPYKLFIGKEKVEASTDDQGKITHKIPNGIERARLELDGQVIQLLFGHLDPINETTGIQQRLKNLGYYPGDVDGIEGPLTRMAVEIFQGDYPPLKEDGICGSKTRSKLKEIYGA